MYKRQAIRCDDDIEMSEIQPTVSRARCQQFPTEYCEQKTYYKPVNGILRDRAVISSQKRLNENNCVSQTGSAMRVTDSCEQNYIYRSDCVSNDRCNVRVSSVNQPVRRHDVVTTQAHNVTDAWAVTNSDSLYVSQPVNRGEVIRSGMCVLSSENVSAVVRQSPIPRFGRNSSPISRSRDNCYDCLLYTSPSPRD